MKNVISRPLAFLLGFTLTLAAVIVTNRVSMMFERWSVVPLIYVGVAAAQLGLIAVLIYRSLGGPTRIVGASLFTGVPAGVLIARRRSLADAGADVRLG